MFSLPLRQRLQAYMNVSRLLIRKYMALISYHLSSHRVLCLVEREGFMVANHYRSSYRSGICICVSFQYSFFPKLVCVSYLLSVLVLRTVSCVVCYVPLDIFLNIILYCIFACLLFNTYFASSLRDLVPSAGIALCCKNNMFFFFSSLSRCHNNYSYLWTRDCLSIAFGVSVLIFLSFI